MSKPKFYAAIQHWPRFRGAIVWDEDKIPHFPGLPDFDPIYPDVPDYPDVPGGDWPIDPDNPVDPDYPDVPFVPGGDWPDDLPIDEDDADGAVDGLLPPGDTVDNKVDKFVLESADGNVTIAYMMGEDFTITSYNHATTEFKAIGWIRLSYHTTGEHAGKFTLDDFRTVESGGWNYLKNIRYCSRNALYYNGVQIWPETAYYLYGTPSESGNVALGDGDGYVLYNGAVLPKLPEYDAVTHPYVYIATGSGGTKTYAIFSPKIISVQYPGKELLGGGYNSTTYDCITYYESNGAWVKTYNSLFYVAVWSNADVYYFDSEDESINGTLCIAASEPIPLASNEPVAAVYNGVKLPVLPEWDKEKYPYARMGVSVTDNTDYRLLIGGVASKIGSSGELVFLSGANYSCENGEWVKVAQDAKSYKVIWANYDVYYADDTEEVGGTIYLAKSDPIPVYEQKE